MTSPNGKRYERDADDVPKTVSGIPLASGPKDTGVRRRLDRTTGKEVEPGELPTANRHQSGTRKVNDLKKSLKDDGMPPVLDKDYDREIDMQELMAETADQLEAAIADDSNAQELDVDITFEDIAEEDSEPLVAHRIIQLNDETALEEEENTKVEGKYRIVNGKHIETLRTRFLQQINGPDEVTSTAAKVINDVIRVTSVPELPTESISRRDQLPTLVEPFIAKRLLASAGLDDRLSASDWEKIDEIGMEAVFEIAAERKRAKNLSIDAVNGRRNGKVVGSVGEFVNNWWESNDPIERSWGQLSVFEDIVPLWQLSRDLEEILEKKIVNFKVTEFKGQDEKGRDFRNETIVELLYTHGCLREMLYEKLTTEGFRGRVYTEQQLGSIIARKPPSGRPPNP